MPKMKAVHIDKMCDMLSSDHITSCHNPNLFSHLLDNVLIYFNELILRKKKKIPRSAYRRKPEKQNIN